MQRRATKTRRKARAGGGKPAAATAARTAVPRSGEPLPRIDDLEGRRWRWDDPTTMFSGPRPESYLSGLEPAFLLFDSEVMEAVRARAAERGMAYDTLVRMIVREHVHDY